jgi:two-component system OmpR family sensor kinase
MWGIASSRANRLLTSAWIAFAVINVGLMFALPGEETIPFHFVWISFALIYGLRRPWPGPKTLVALGLITTSTFGAMLHSMELGYIGAEELAEIPLMAGLFLVMSWHVRRRQQSLGQVERLVALESRRAEAIQLFVRLGSHELRTPITVARGYTELIRAAHSDLTTEEDTGIVLDELAKLERITARLLTLLAVDTTAPLSVVNLDDVLDRILRRWTPTADRRWNVESEVGDASINVDRVETAIDSLLENAVKFTESGDPIGVYARKSFGDIIIEVRDGGHGIPADELPLIFDHFTTGRTAGERAGTGLGLPTVRSAFAARGGTVDVASRVGHGTTFTIRFPEHAPVAPIVPDQSHVPSEATIQRRRSTDAPLAAH